MRQRAWICTLLAAAVVAAYWTVGRNAFIMLDDGVYLVDNPRVQQGLTWDSVRWAFTTGHAANWHPLTWLSHMLDCQVFGLRPTYHHWMNVLLHVANSVLLYLVLRRLTGAEWRSVAVAALFALHPLHVESVAWAAERKDMLSTLFWMLTLAAYARYAVAPSWHRYGPVVICFALGLLAKPMLVTLPFVLLLLDYWPLKRLRRSAVSEPAAARATLWWLVIEKIPLLILTVASCLVTFLVQQRGGAVQTLDTIPLEMRLANALVVYAAYLGKMLWPFRLAVYYPYVPVATWQWLAAGTLLAAITVLTIGMAKRRPYLAVGWLWYLGTLVPVIGLVQVGAQSMADRYTYVPLIGVFVMLVWAAADVAAVASWGKRAVHAVLGVILVGCLVLSMLQVTYWRNSLRLFEHAAQVTKDNAVAHCNVGVALCERQETEQAIVHYRKALRIKPDWALAHNNLGAALAVQGQVPEAVAHFRAALAADPESADIHRNLGKAFTLVGQYEQALRHYREAIRLAPQQLSVGVQLAWLLATCPESEFRGGAEALRLAEQAASLPQGRSPGVRDTLAAAYAATGRFPEAVREAEQALTLAKSAGNGPLAEQISQRLDLYHKQRPYYETAPVKPAKTRTP